jgi:hypothetical protein
MSALSVRPVFHLKQGDRGQFYRQNPNPTKEQLLTKATDIDREYGVQFTPPVKHE